MKKVLLAAFAVLACCAVRAQNAQTLLERFVDRMNGDKGITMKAHAVISGPNTDDEQTVSFAFSGMRFMIGCDSRKFWFDGKTSWNASAQDGEIDEIYIEEPAGLENLTSDLIKRHDGFQVSGDGRKSFTLTSDNPDGFNGICSLTFSLDQQTLEPRSLKVVMNRQTGLTIDIAVRDFKSGQNLSADTFRCNTANYPDAETIDLR